jgi:hypothetical protein
VKRKALRKRYGRSSNASVTAPGARYEIWARYPKTRGGGYLKQRHFAGRGRDAHEVLATLYEYREGTRAAGGYRRPMYVVLDMHAKRGKLAPIVSEAELEARKSRGG